MGRNNLTVEPERLTFTMSRVFDAPRQRVWQAHTDPEQILKWWGPRKYETIVDTMDVRVGGKWWYLTKDAEGNEFAFHGEYKEIVEPKRITWTFEFEPMAGHIFTETITFEEVEDGKTKVTTQSVFDSLEDLDGMLQSGMEDGATETWDRLEGLVRTK